MGGASLLLAGAVIGFLIMFRGTANTGWEAAIMRTVGAVVGAFLGGVVYLLFSTILLNTMPAQQYTVSKEPLVPLQGNVYLGNGLVNDSIEWSYATKSNVGVTVNSAKTDKILVNVENGLKNPYIEKVSKKFTSERIEGVFPAEFLAGQATIIHIPENSIKYGYNLNVK